MVPFEPNCRGSTKGRLKVCACLPSCPSHSSIGGKQTRKKLSVESSFHDHQDHRLRRADDLRTYALKERTLVKEIYRFYKSAPLADIPFFPAHLN